MTRAALHPPFDGGSKFAKQILGWGKPEVKLQVATECVFGDERALGGSTPKSLRCASRFRPSLKGRVV